MRIGLIVEGPTDLRFFETLIPCLLQEYGVGEAPHFILLQPKRQGERLSQPRGWSGIQQWLKQKGEMLKNLKQWSDLAFVVLHMDGDALRSGPCTPSADEQWKSVSDQLLRWADLPGWPKWVVLAIPLQHLEAWICPALEGCKLRNPQLECEHQPEMYLPKEYQQIVARKRRGENDNVGETYATFGLKTGERWDAVLQCCPIGAGRFHRMLQQYIQQHIP